MSVLEKNNIFFAILLKLSNSSKLVNYAGRADAKGNFKDKSFTCNSREKKGQSTCDNGDFTLSIDPCLEPVLVPWNLFICLGMDCLINFFFFGLFDQAFLDQLSCFQEKKPEIFLLWIRTRCRCWCLEYSRVEHNLEIFIKVVTKGNLITLMLVF